MPKGQAEEGLNTAGKYAGKRAALLFDRRQSRLSKLEQARGDAVVCLATTRLRMEGFEIRYPLLFLPTEYSVQRAGNREGQGQQRLLHGNVCG